jgi:hypothetical protein
MFIFTKTHGIDIFKYIHGRTANACGDMSSSSSLALVSATETVSRSAVDFFFLAALGFPFDLGFLCDNLIDAGSTALAVLALAFSIPNKTECHHEPAAFASQSLSLPEPAYNIKSGVTR